MVVFEGMRPTLVGVLIGAAGALALGRVLSGLIYGVKPTDPITFLAVAILLSVIALLASIIPAYRATKVDPMAALRYE
jgi:putative ABC transport system permease protein